MQSDFKHINVVPIGNEFFDHLTTRSRVSSSGLKLNRLRKLYTRQVTNTHLTFSNKLSTILNDFPPFDDIHPLYTDLLRFVFDKKRYSFSLGQVNTARRLIANVANDYANLLEFGGSVKECKALKASAVSEMFSVVNEITPGLAYLEQLRQHMVKLPLVDPDVPTILVSGYPHADKACFFNGIVDFRTKSTAFDVGFSGYDGLMRCQVMDRVLDKPVFGGECNVVVDALARHLGDAIVLFFLDVSCSCGYSVADQVVFLYSVKATFVDRPLLVVCDESDLMLVSEEDWRLIEDMDDGEEVGLKISDLRSEEGLISVKNAACEWLLDQRGRLISCISLDEARVMRNKYILEDHQELDGDDDHEVSDLFVEPDVLFRLEEQEHEGVIKHAEEEEQEEDEEEDDDFVMAEERFTEEHKGDQLVAIHKIQPLRILIAFGFCILVGNTYGTVQQCLSTLSFFG
ncbi:Nucleolar GTP-binding protein 1 [Hirschfeldia incana]|nr:Nucleolar GTP-binding protein 1 [Hirschfeldia incana]